MKKCFAMVVSALWVTGSVSMAQITNPIPYADTYENYSAGSNLVGTVWQGVTGTSLAVVTGLTYSPPSVGYSVTNPPGHTQVMSFSDGPITNEFNGTSLTTVALDTMIKPMFAETPSGSQMGPVSNSQMSVYIDTNGYVNVFHGNMSGSTPGIPTSFQWTTFTNVSKIDSGSWVRLTVVMNYDLSRFMAMYKVTINGISLTNETGYVSPINSSAKGGAWFVSPLWDDANLSLHRVVLSGSGMLDDMVVTTNTITYASQVDLGNATNGVPIQWLIDSGLTTNGTLDTWDKVALDDKDNDGAPNWTERLAGTDPTNEFSKLVIISSTFSNGYPILKWIGTTNALNPYNIQWSSNLTIISGWTTITSGLPRGDSTHSTNEVTLPAAPYTPAFLRVTVTN